MVMSGVQIESNQIKLKVIYLAKQRLVAVDIGSRPLIQAQIIADIMDGCFCVRGHS